MSSSQLFAVAHSINSAMRDKYCSMKIGEIIDHPDGYKVKVIDGTFLDPVYGRVSNFWTWCRVNEDGSLGKKEHGYGW